MTNQPPSGPPARPPRSTGPGDNETETPGPRYRVDYRRQPSQDPTAPLPSVSAQDTAATGEDQVPAEPTPARPTPAPNAAVRRRTRFWAGFAAGFLLLSALSCGGLFMATGLSRVSLRDLQAGGQNWSPPAVTATPIAAETPIIEESQQVASGTFQAGEELRNGTSSVVNIRATPGYLSKPSGDVIAQVPPGDNVEIVGDRAMADNLTWWLIRYRPTSGPVVEGWMAEATASGVQILAR